MDPVTENAVAIAMHLGMSELRDAAYQAAADQMGGFVGFYPVAAEAGEVIEELSKKEDISWGDQADWILTIESYADAILKLMANKRRVPSKVELGTLAKQSIYYNMEPKFPAPTTAESIVLLRNVLSAGIEGGINYWAQIDAAKNVYPAGSTKQDFREGGKMQPKRSDGSEDYFHWAELLPTTPGGAIFLKDVSGEFEEGEEYRLDLPSLQKGLSIVKHKYPKVYKNIMEDNYDADDGDILVQTAIFGEQIYG